MKRIILMVVTVCMLSATCFASSEPSAKGLEVVHNDFSNNTIYYNKFDVSSVALYATLEVNNATHKPTLYIHADCQGDTGNWQYYDKVYITTDNNSYIIDCDSQHLHRVLLTGLIKGETWQDVATAAQIDMLRDIATAGKVTYRFSGRKNKVRELGGANKTRLVTMLSIYDFYKK